MKKQNKSFALWVVIGLLGLFSIGSIAWAGASFSWSGVEEKVASLLAGKIVVPVDEPASNDELLGAVSSPNIASTWLCVNKDCTYHLSEAFIDASTTIASFADPFLTPTSSATDIVVKLDDSGRMGYTGATSTVEFVQVVITGVATTSYNLGCGAAQTPYATSTGSYNILTSDLIPTSTKGVIENNVASTYNKGIGGGSVAKIMLTPTEPYLICRVWPNNLPKTYYEQAFTDVGHTFDGIVTIRVTRSQY